MIYSYYPIVCAGPYPDKFKAGDYAIPKLDVKFMDGTRHIIDERVEVTEENKAYFNVHYQHYDKA